MSMRSERSRVAAVLDAVGRTAFLLVVAVAMCIAAAPALAAEPLAACPFRLPTPDVSNIHTVAQQRITQWRAQLKLPARELETRLAMADYAINLLLRANRMEASGQEQAARKLRDFVRRTLPDTDWRIQFNARQGDLGAIEARIGWLRSLGGATMTTDVCALAARGELAGGAESAYRMAFCVKSRDDMLKHMMRASDRGHAAAMEVSGRLCLAGKLSASCSLQRLCLAAQAGRVGAAGSIGWHLTGLDGAQSSKDGGAWLQRAAEANDPIAQNNLGEWHERHGAAAGGTMALNWYRRAAASGLPAAMVNAARLLSLGDDRQCREARTLLLQASKSGLAQAAEWVNELSCS